VLNDLALLRDAAGEDGALEAARDAHAIAPERVEVLDTLGWLLVRSGEPEAGLRYLREAHSRASEIAEIRYHVGAALAALGREAEARAELEAALGNDASFPGIEGARALLAELNENE